MNIYLIIEDHESFCMKGETMSEVIDACEGSYVKDVLEDAAKDGRKTTEEAEKSYYNADVLQSCALVGELKN